MKLFTILIISLIFSIIPKHIHASFQVENPNFTVDEDLKCGNGINTAMGCIPINDLTGFLSNTTILIIGIGGGIFLLIFSYGGFLIMTSEGDPRKLRTGQEIIISAIAGLLLMVFGVLIIKIFNVDLFGF